MNKDNQELFDLIKRKREELEVVTPGSILGQLRYQELLTMYSLLDVEDK